MQEIIDKARTLVEALPYMRAFYDKMIVIKFGGASMVDAELKASFATDVTLLRYIGLRPVIVHGGGPQIGKMLERLGKESTFVDGMRVTDDETMEIVEMVLGGHVNAEIVELIGRAGGRAVGLTGKDSGLMRVTRKTGAAGQDLGRVGTPTEIDASVLLTMSKNGFIPVVAPIGTDEAGETYNVNGDAAAGKIAQALGAEKLILLTDVEVVTVNLRQDVGGRGFVDKAGVGQVRIEFDSGNPPQPFVNRPLGEHEGGLFQEGLDGEHGAKGQW